MDINNPWPLVENPFDNRTRNSRKAMHKIGTDHNDKLSAKAGAGTFFSDLWTAWQAPWTAWGQAYGLWVNTSAARISCTRALEGLLAETKEKPPGDGARSLIDQWESPIAALYGRESSEYVFYFPRGRDPFTGGSREDIIMAVHTLNDRLAGKVAPLQAAQAALEAQVAALVAANVPVPPELQDSLDAATDRATTVQRLAVRTGTFYLTLTEARTEQQACEGAVDAASTALNVQRVRLARRLLINFHLLAAHHCDIDAPGENPQFAAADYFDLDTLMQRPNDEGPDEPPPPEPPPGP